MGCAASTPEFQDGSPTGGAGSASATAQRQMPPPLTRVASQLPSGGFASAQSPLFEEYLNLLAIGSPVDVGSINSDDALVVIDMQNDFVPADPQTNPHGGRFGVSEGDDVVLPIVQLIEHFVKRGGHVLATRDYHPHDHCSFLDNGGPFPKHCVQGTVGAQFLPPINKALSAGKTGGGRVAVAFKAMHEDVDSFGGFPYADGGVDRITTRGKGREAEQGLPCMMGCTAAPWTGALLLKQSGLQAAASGEGGFAVDMDAPPDVFAAINDGKDRGMQSITTALQGCKRVFVCGLALDFCVLDSCLNASGLGFRNVFMILDATRAAHIPGVGSYGTGFLSDPQQIKAKLGKAEVRCTSVERVTGASPLGFIPHTGGFPASLGPLGIIAAESKKINLSVNTGQRSYKIHGGLEGSMLASLGDVAGTCSPRAPMPANWPGAPFFATALCWAYPLPGVSDLQETGKYGFLAVTASPALQVAAYGGFLLLDRNDKVVGVQAISPVESPSSALHFGDPRPWRDEFTEGLKAQGRFQPVTLPSLRTRGATHFCWVSPGETFTSGPEEWSPSKDGAFLYLLADGRQLWFPTMPLPARV